jgi:hypothetical protein
MDDTTYDQGDYQDQVDQTELRQARQGIPLAPTRSSGGALRIGSNLGRSQPVDSDEQAPPPDPSQPDQLYSGSMAQQGQGEGDRGLKAFGDEVWASTLQAGQSVLGLASLATRQLTSDPEAVGVIERAKQALQDHVDRTVSALAPGQQNALHASFFGGKDEQGNDLPVPGRDVGWGAYLGAQVANFMPQAALAVLPGGLVGKAVTKVLGEGAALAAGAASRAATAGTFGALDAGDAYNALVQEIDQAKPEELIKSPVYQHLREQGVDDVEARRQLVTAIAPSFAAQRFAVGAASGAGLGEFLAHGVVGAAEKSALARVGIGAAEGAATLGGQAAGDQYFQQGAEQQAGLRQGYDIGAITKAGMQGALGGALLGAGAGAFRTKAAPEQIAPFEPAAADALQGALSGDQTQTPASQPGVPPNAQQGNLFTDSQLRQPPRPPPVPDAPQGQGDLFNPDQPGTAPPTQAPTQDQTQTPPAATPPGQGDLLAAQPAPAQTPPLTSRKDLIAAVKALPGAPEKGLAGMKLADLKNLHQDLTEKAQAAPPAPEVPAGPTDTTVVESTPAAPTVDAVEQTTQPADTADTAPSATGAAEGEGSQGTASANPPAETVAETPPPAQAPAEAPTTLPTPVDKVAALKAKAAAKRAAEKARMADKDKVQVPKAQAFVGDDAPVAREEALAPPELPPARVERTREEASQDLVAAIPEAAARATPRKGVSTAQIEREISRKVQAEINRFPDAKGEDAVHSGIQRWANEGGVVAGTTTPRADIANLLLRDILGEKGAKRVRERFAEEAVGNAREEGRQVFETETHNRVAIDDPNAEGKQVADAGGELDAGRAESGAVEHADEHPTLDLQGGGEHETSARVENAGSKEQHADELLTRVIEGQMTPDEAHEAYGVPQGGKGRPRKYPTFASYVREMARRAVDPERNDALLRKMIEVGKITDRAKRAALSKEIQNELGVTGKDHAERLNNIADQLEDPIGHAVKSHGNIYAFTSDNRFIAAMRDPELNDALISQIKASSKYGVELRLHDLLDTILAHAKGNPNLKAAEIIARRLKDLGVDVPISTHADVRDQFGYNPDYRQDAAYAVGKYVPPHISFNEKLFDNKVGRKTTIENVLHEAMHAAASDRIERAYHGDSPEDKRIRDTIDAIIEEIRNHLANPGRDSEYLSDFARDRLKYAISNPHELHAVLSTSPDAQEWLNTRKASPALQAELARYGVSTPSSAHTVWKKFTDFVRKLSGFKQVESADTRSLLDHILTPLDEITRQGAEYRKSLADYPDVAARGAQTLELGIRSIQDHKRDFLRAVDTPAIGDKLRKGLLQFVPLDHIVDRYRDLFQHADHSNPLADFRRAMETENSHAQNYRDREGNHVASLLSRLDRPGAEKLGAFMRDVTLADARMDPADPIENAHVDADTMAALEQRYNALTPEHQETYKAVRDYYARAQKETRAARFESIIKQAFPDLTPEQHKTLIDAAGSKKKLDAIAKDDTDLGRVFGDRWESSGKLVREILKIHRLGYVQGDYFPLRRFGDYVVRYGDRNDPESYGVEMFEKKGDALARHAELLAAETPGLTDVSLKRQSNLAEIAPAHPAVDELTRRLEADPALADHAEDVRNMLLGALMEHATRSEQARTLLRRKSVLGASDKAGRILAREYISTANQLGHLKAGGARYQAISRMRDVAQSLEQNRHDGSGLQARQVINEVEQRIATGDEQTNALIGLSKRATSLGFVQALMSPSHMLTSSIETHTNSQALMGARYGGMRAAGALTKALADITPTLLKTGAGTTLKAMMRGLKNNDWKMSEVMRERLVQRGADAGHMKALGEALDRAGLVDHTAEREMQRIANPAGYDVGAGKAWQRFLDINAAGAHAVDVANKWAVAKAVFDLELKETGDVGKAVEYATDTVRRASPNYNLYNKSRISTTKGVLKGFAAPLTQFKQYGFHMYSLMANLTKSSMHGATPEARREARYALAGILATHAVMAGALTLVADPIRYVGGAYDLITGADGPHNYENDVRGWLASTFGPEIGEIIARGAPHALGIDIYRRVGLGNLLEMPDLDNFKSASFLKAAGALMTGASAESAANMVQGISKVFHGDVLGGLQDIVPRVVRDVMKANKLATTGVTDTRGNVVLPPDKIGQGGVLAQALGFQPAVVSEFREGRAAVQEAVQEAKQERSALEQAFLNADPADRPVVLSQIRQYNASGKGAPLQLDALYRALAQRAQGVKPGTTSFGVRVPHAASGAANAGEFANV